MSTTVGTSLSYDATRGGTVFSDPAGGGLVYSLTFIGASNGLQATGTTVSGTPAAPGVVTVTVTATDS
ncbi:MAG TPA: hypothetical protein VE871_12580, partial [Longimicrobium sp.]|nr:hypothetical protein [Longimicrobium sp.]